MVEETALEDLLLGVTMEYDPTVMEDIADWVFSEGSEIMFIYGE